MFKKGLIYFSAVLAASLASVSLAEDFGVTNDVWDVHNGNVITATSGFQSSLSDPGMFGGQDWPGSPITTHFADGQPSGFVHFVEWRTPAPVTVKRVRLFAAGDGAIYDNGREMARFTLKIKSPGSATFDTTVLTFAPTHPYTDLGEKFLILDATFDAVTATEFRGEFEQIDLRAAGWNAPRVIELDAFGSEPPVITPPPPPPVSSSTPSGEDLWDVSRGTIVTRSSPVYPETSGPGLFGGGGYSGEVGDTIFADNQYSGFVVSPGNPWPFPFPPPPATNTFFATNGSVHFVEWKTVTPVTVTMLRMFASGDGPQYSYGREMGRFTLKIKSPGSTDFDATVFTFVPSHPYVFLNPTSSLILETNLPAFTAQEFRGEFEQINLRAAGWNAPRVMELDAFGPPPSPEPIIFGQPVPTTVWVGTDAHFSVGATGEAPLSFTWKHGSSDVVLSDRIQSDGRNLVIHHATVADAGEYSVVVANAAGHADSNPAALTVNLDTVAPVVTISSPTPGVFGSTTVRLSGKITDNVALASARWEQNGSPGGSVGLTNSEFSIPLILASGANTLKVFAVDASGNEGSAQVSVSLSATAQSSDDLWDVSRGTIVTRSSPTLSEEGGPGLFGGGGFIGEPGDTIFADDNFHTIHFIPGFPPPFPPTIQTNLVQTNGFVHFVEWKTVDPVTVSTIRLFASGDGESYSYGREMGRFTLKTKSAGSTEFDVTVLSFVPQHPYVVLDAYSSLILETNVPAFTAQEFRSEFEQLNLRAAGWNAPRVMELDAFGPLPPKPQILQLLNVPRSAAMSLTFKPAVSFGIDGAPHLELSGSVGSTYLIEGSSDLEHWTALGAFECTAGTIPVDDTPAIGASTRFYRAILLGQ